MSFAVVIPMVAGIGNALMAVPMVRQLRAGKPDAQITVLARNAAMGDIFRRLPEVEEVVVTKGGLKGNARGVAESRKRAPDLYLIPFPSNRWQYSMLAATSGARTKLLHAYSVGYWQALHFLPSTRVTARRGIHDVKQNLELLRAIGITPNLEDAPTFAVTDSERDKARKLLSGIENPIVIHAGSAQTVLARAKRWPADRYAALIHRLDAQFPGRVVLVEGPDEAGITDEIRRASEGQLPGTVIKLAGPIGEAAALLASAALYVGSDSGLAHLSAAVGTTPVTIFGPADPDRVCPCGYRELVVQSPRNCNPCFLYPWETPYPKIRCKPPYCIESITVAQVMEAVDRASRVVASEESRSG